MHTPLGFAVHGNWFGMSSSRVKDDWLGFGVRSKGHSGFVQTRTAGRMGFIFASAIESGRLSVQTRGKKSVSKPGHLKHSPASHYLACSIATAYICMATRRTIWYDVLAVF